MLKKIWLTGRERGSALVPRTLGAVAIWFIGFETRGRTIEEMDSTLTARAPRPQACAA